jgi:hypothetical protein
MNNALNSLGLTNRGQLMNSEQATLVGSAMSAGHVAARKGQDVQAAINGVLNSQKAKTIQNKAYEAIKSAYVEKAGAKGTFTDRDFANEMARVERSAVEELNRGFNRQSPRNSRPGQDVDSDFRSNVVTDIKGNPVTSKSGNVLTEAGRVKKDNLTAIANQARVNKEEAQKRADYEAARQAGMDARVAQQEAIAKQQQARIESGQYSGVDSSQDFSDSFGDDGGSGGFSDSDGDTGPGNEGSGGISDSFGGGDYKGAFVGEAYKKNKLAKQMKRSGLASKK